MLFWRLPLNGCFVEINPVYSAIDRFVGNIASFESFDVASWRVVGRSAVSYWGNKVFGRSSKTRLTVAAAASTYLASLLVVAATTPASREQTTPQPLTEPPVDDTPTTSANPATAAMARIQLARADAAPWAPGKAPGASADCQQVKCVAITFDDGPAPGTNKVLDVLDRFGVPATFYVLGSRVERYPQIVQRIADEGHEIGNHSHAHRDLASLNTSDVVESLESTNANIASVIGEEPPTMRPPYGSHNDTVDSVTGAPIVLWDVDTLDWKHKDPTETLQIVQEQTGPGSIILMHDIHDATVAAVEPVVQHLIDEGYVLVTVSDLLASQNPQAGHKYSSLPAPAADDADDADDQDSASLAAG